MQADRGIDALYGASRSRDLGQAQIGLQVALRGDVRRLNLVKVHELQLGYSEGRKLQRDLSTDGSDSDHGDFQIRQHLAGDQARLPRVAIHPFNHRAPPRLVRRLKNKNADPQTTDHQQLDSLRDEWTPCDLAGAQAFLRP